MTEHSIFVDSYGEGSLGGEPVSFNAEDQVVAAQNECYEMPGEPGWYQINARINGTGYDGSYVDTADQDAGIFSHYFYICECGSEEEAREQLGPPPSEEDDGTSESTPTATAEQTATAEPDDGGSEQTATAEQTATVTAEPDEEGSEQTAIVERTATATAEPDDDGATEQTATATAGQTATAEQTATATAGSNTGGGQAQPSGQQSGPGTPTIGAGPGFGLVAALGGLVAVALLALRRD